MDRPTPSECLNCGTSLAGAYCSNCGQKAGPPVLTTRELLHESWHELFDWDGKVPSTLWTLFTQPGRLTTDVLLGRRARWLSPLRVYLICSIAFFAVKPVLETVTGRSPRANIRLDIGLQPGQKLTPEQRDAIAKELPAQVFGIDRLARAIENGTNFSREAESSFPTAMFLLLPVFALFTRLAWSKRRREYAAHVITALHIHAAAFGAGAVYWIVATATPWTGVGAVAMFLLVTYWAWYGLSTFRRVYGDSWFKTIIKTILIMVPYMMLSFMAGFAIMALVVFSF